MRFNPHDYQRYAIEFIKAHPVAAVLLDCGMGKTAITLSAIHSLMYDSFEVSRVLVIAPIRVATVSWPDEIEKWDGLKKLTYSVAVGTPEQRRAALMQEVDIHIINRENVTWLVEESGVPLKYDMIIIDELSSFKNHQSKRFKSLMRLRPRAKRCVGLTGTPSSNGLMDLFAEFRCLDMGERLGRFIGQYRNTYFIPDRCNGPIVYSYKPRTGAEEEIYRKISDITISMRAVDHLKMPELVSSEYTVHMDEREKQRYDELKKDLILQLPEGEVTAANAASLSGKLLQMANGAVYDDDQRVVPIHKRKLEALEDIIEAANGKPILVAYWFQHDLDRIRKHLEKLKIDYIRVTGEGSIRMWNEGKIPVGLIHPASAGHGLNLQSGGSTIVWYGLTWSLELYQQTNARLYRQGQKDSTVVVQHIITKGTIDERVMKALQMKDNTQSALIDAVKAEVA